MSSTDQGGGKRRSVINHSTSTRRIFLSSVVRDRFLNWISSWILGSPWLCASVKAQLAPWLDPSWSRPTAPRIPLPFAGVATGAEAVESPATQLQAGELVPLNYGAGSSGVAPQAALVWVQAAAPSIRAQAGALGWARPGA
jgi:hypothetical protein